MKGNREQDHKMGWLLGFSRGVKTSFQSESRERDVKVQRDFPGPVRQLTRSESVRQLDIVRVSFFVCILELVFAGHVLEMNFLKVGHWS